MNQRQQRLNISLVTFRKNSAAPKTKDLTDEKNYHPITCLKDLAGKYMRETYDGKSYLG